MKIGVFRRWTCLVEKGGYKGVKGWSIIKGEPSPMDGGESGGKSSGQSGRAHVVNDEPGGGGEFLGSLINSFERIFIEADSRRRLRSLEAHYLINL